MYQGREKLIHQLPHQLLEQDKHIVCGEKTVSRDGNMASLV